MKMLDLYLGFVTATVAPRKPGSFLSHHFETVDGAAWLKIT